MRKLLVVIPVYDLVDEAVKMVHAVRESIQRPNDVEYLLVDIRNQPHRVSAKDSDMANTCAYLEARHIPAAKNLATRTATGELILFLFPGLFPCGNAVQLMVNRLCENH